MSKVPDNPQRSGRVKFAESGRGALEEARTDVVSLPRARGDDRMIDGASFVFNEPEIAPAVWGEGEEILWSEGETLIICGPPGVGKTTLAQQIVLARLGILNDVLGFPVKDNGTGRVL